jgi:outer membrane receptor for ferrienterochelin and colicin
MKTLLQSILTAVVVMITFDLSAQQDSLDITELSLDELQNVKIVTASKNLMAASQVPASTYVITEEQIRARNYRSLLDVLMDAPDFKIDDRVYSTSRNTATMRGITGQDKFIIMLDGVRVSSPTNEMLPIMENYPVNLARQIEIIYGPASALYGADALSGIINIISKRAEFSPVKAEASYSMGDRGLVNGNIFASRKIAKDGSVTISGQYFYDNGVDMSREFSEDTLWDMTSHRTGTFNTIYGPMTPVAPVKNEFSMPLFAYNIYAGLRTGDFEFSYFRSQTENSSAIENNPSNAVYNRDVLISRGVNVFNSRFTKTLDKLSFVTTLTASQFREDPQSVYRNMFTGMEPAYKYAYGSMIQAEEQIEWKPATNTNIVAGIVYQNFYSLPESADLHAPVDDSHSIEGILLNTPSLNRPQGIEAKFYSVKYSNGGVYAQLQQKALPSLMLTAGARYDYNTRFGSTFNPRLGAVWNAGKHTLIKLMAGTAYLAPTPSSGYSYYGTFYTEDDGLTYRSNFFHLPNPDLKPMISRNLEMSIRYSVHKNLSAAVSGYYTSVTNLVDYAADDGNTNLYNGKFLGWDVDYIEVFVNRGKKQISGLQFQLNYNYNFTGGSLSMYSYLSYITGEQEVHRTDINGQTRTYDVDLDIIADLTWKIGGDLTIKGFSFSPRLVWMNDQHLPSYLDPENPKERQTIPGYTLLNVALGYRFGKLTVFANITNALNQTYRAVGPNMDLQKQPTELFYGNVQDPIRVNGGIRFGI